MVHLLWQFSPLAILPLLAPVASSPLVVTENESVTRYTSSGEAELAILDDLQDAVSDKRELDFRSLGSHCSSPFGYGQSERNRLKSCYTDVMVAAYDADVHFAFQIASIISDAATKGSTKSPAKRLREGFNFIAQTEKGDCYNTIGLEPLCNLIVCQSTHPADVGDLARGLVADPKDGPVSALTGMCTTCNNDFGSQMCTDNPFSFTGGSGGGSGFTLYCTVKATGKTTVLLESGGGGGGGGNDIEFGGGGGGGLTAFVDPNENQNKYKCGGGCGGNFDCSNIKGTGSKSGSKSPGISKGPKNSKTPKKSKSLGVSKGPNASKGPKKSKKTRNLRRSVQRNLKGGSGGFQGATEGGTDKACGSGTFTKGVETVQDKIRECLANPKTDITIESGGGQGGCASSSGGVEVYDFRAGFYFDSGPPRKQTAGETTASLLSSCSFSYAQALCNNAGYTNQLTAYSLCQCLVSQLYNPAVGTFACPASSSGTPVTEALITKNCATWCPSGVKDSAGNSCPALSICASC